MNRWTRYAIAFVIVSFRLASAEAGIRWPYEDAAVIDRSEAIVVGRLEKDSIQYVSHNNNGASWEYHATLIVSETLKGSLRDKQVAIVINYGLDPLVGGVGVRPNKSLYPGPAPTNIPPDRIDIIDSGTVIRAYPVLANAQNDNLWFLRHLHSDLERKQGEGSWGIRDPEDVQPLKFKDYFQSLLRADVEREIDRLLTNPDEVICLRTLRYLSARHRPSDAERITKLFAAGNEKVQTAAAESLAEVADLSAVPTFRELLKNPYSGVRLTACNFLCRFRDVQSIVAIGKLLPEFDSMQRARLIANLPRMESREVIDLLLDQLDEHLDSKLSPMSAYCASSQAAKALMDLTGIEFPVDTAQARRRWDEYKALPDEVLLRKALLEDIESLTRPRDYNACWSAYESLGRLANQHFGPHDAFHEVEECAGREKSQRLWRLWAKDNVARSRIDWIYEGFAKSGIDLPRPMNAKGIDTLIAVLEYYGDWHNWKGDKATHAWSFDGHKPAFHTYYANWLLERLTGYQVGLSPYYQDLRISDRKDNIAFDRWAAWWKENRDKVTIQPLPEEKAVTAEMLSKTSSLRLPPKPLTLTIRPAKEIHIFKGKEPLAIVVEIKNTSTQNVLVERRPAGVHYLAKTVTGSCGGGGRGGQCKEDFVTLKPTESISWNQTDAPSVDDCLYPESIENLHYELTYSCAGSQFGLHAWRGKLLSNQINVIVKKTK